jgi:putative endonuclease
MRASDALGRYGEDVAARHLAADGMAILQRNWRCDLGEIDIVADDAGVLVVCEVKTRRGLGFGGPSESVTREKLARLRRLCARWLQDQPEPRRFTGVRLDVVGVLRPLRGPAQIDHVRGVG